MVTIKDIARLANVTPSTVSRVLNQSGGYREKTKQRVEKIAQELHYQKNEAASNLVAKTSNLIGVIITNATTSFAAPIIDRIEDWAYQHGGRILLAHGGQGDPQRLKACLNLMAGRKVNGIISVSVQFDKANLKLLKELQIPLVSISVEVPDFPAITIDDFNAAKTGTEYLIKRGYQKIAFVGINVNDTQTGTKRINGYQTAMQDAGLTPVIKGGDFSFESGKQAFNELIASKEVPAAIFAASDEAAAGVIYAAQAHEIKIPDQLAVLGFDNAAIAKMVYPGLTTIHQPFAKMGQLAIEQLINHETKSQVLPFKIEKRGTVPEN